MYDIETDKDTDYEGLPNTYICESLKEIERNKMREERVCIDAQGDYYRYYINEFGLEQRSYREYIPKYKRRVKAKDKVVEKKAHIYEVTPFLTNSIKALI